MSTGYISHVKLLGGQPTVKGAHTVFPGRPCAN
jgi:hypothetical protein